MPADHIRDSKHQPRALPLRYVPPLDTHHERALSHNSYPEGVAQRPRLPLGGHRASCWLQDGWGKGSKFWGPYLQVTILDCEPLYLESRVREGLSQWLSLPQDLPWGQASTVCWWPRWPLGHSCRIPLRQITHSCLRERAGFPLLSERTGRRDYLENRTGCCLTI